MKKHTETAALVMAIILVLTAGVFADTPTKTYTLTDYLQENEFDIYIEPIYLIPISLSVKAEDGNELVRAYYGFSKNAIVQEKDSVSNDMESSCLIPLVRSKDGTESLTGTVNQDTISEWVNLGYINEISTSISLDPLSSNRTAYLLNAPNAGTSRSWTDSVYFDESLTIDFRATYYSYSLTNYDAYGYAYIPNTVRYRFTSTSGLSDYVFYTYLYGQCSRNLSDLSQIDEYGPYYERENICSSVTANTYITYDDYSLFNNEYSGLAFQIYGVGYYRIGTTFRYGGSEYDIYSNIVAGSLS